MMRYSMAVALALAFLLSASAAHAVTLGQLDDFPTSDEMGWFEGISSPNPPTVILGGGPGGAFDNYLGNVSGGFSAGSRLAMLNTTQWTGDFTSAGIVAIKLDLNNLGATDLDVRVAFNGAGGGFASTNSVFLPSGSGWTTAYIPIAPGDFTAVSGPTASLGTNIAATLGAVTEMRILSSTSPAWVGDILEANLGVDNIQAVDAVPEPGSLLLAALGLVGLLFARRGFRR